MIHDAQPSRRIGRIRHFHRDFKGEIFVDAILVDKVHRPVIFLGRGASLAPDHHLPVFKRHRSVFGVALIVELPIGGKLGEFRNGIPLFFRRRALRERRRPEREAPRHQDADQAIQQIFFSSFHLFLLISARFIYSQILRKVFPLRKIPF